MAGFQMQTTSSWKPRVSVLRQRLSAWQMPAWGVPVVLLILCLASYGLLLPALGFYWDDFPISWIGETYGPAGLARYFSTNRPFWSWLYEITVPTLGSQQPLVWQVFNLFWRWVSAVALWGLLRLAWPRQASLAAWAASMYVVFPAFRQQPISLLYSHFFIVFSLFLISQLLTLYAIRRYQGRLSLPGYWAMTLLALGCSLYNLIAMEYFFILEMVRLPLIWVSLGDDFRNWRMRAWRTLLVWLPYLAVFIFVVVWRMFFFTFQTQNYEMSLLTHLRSDMPAALVRLLQNIGATLWVAGPGGWVDVFDFSRLPGMGSLSVLLYIFVVLFTGGLLVFVLLHLPVDRTEPNRRRTGWEMALVGGFACLVAGWPFWLVEVLPSGNFPGDRFTLPFALGMSLVLAGLVAVIFSGTRSQAMLFSGLIALAAGYQLQVTNEYRRDWEAAQRFFWQLSWRAPALEPGTLLLSNVLPLVHYSDNSLTAPINRIYAQDKATESMDYLLYYPDRRLGQSLTSLEPDTPVHVDYLAAEYWGNTSQAIVFVYQPPACLRILDPKLDWESQMLPPDLRTPARLSDIRQIIPAGSPDLPPSLFGPEPARGWCYFFEKADLARQQEDWETVVANGDQAFALGDYPNDPAERIPFIEGYAHTSRWDEALEQTRQAAGVAPAMPPILCRLWQQIEEETSASPEQAEAVRLVRDELTCEP